MKPRLEIRFPLSRQWTYCFGRPYHPEADEFLFNHARSGIMLALQALGLPAGSRIGVMAYNCHTVFNAVAQAGHTPLFLDVTDSLTLDLDDLRKKRESISALVVSHLFGIVSDVETIRKEFPELPVIEDCAHAFGIPEIHGDFAVFSIGQGKLPSLGDGGILMVRNEGYLEATAKLYDEVPCSTKAQVFRQWGKMLLKSMLYTPLIYTVITEPMKRRRKPSSGIETVSVRRMGRGIRALYGKEITSLPQTITQRKLNAGGMDSFLSTLPGVRKVLKGSVNGFMSVAVCDDVPAVKKALREKGIEADTHFAHCIEWAGSFGYAEGSCPQTQGLTRCLLMVPTNE